MCYEEKNRDQFISVCKNDHRFCSECVAAHYSDLIQRQNRADELTCLQHECGEKPTDAFLKTVIPADVFTKYQRFNRDRQVAVDRDNLFHCQGSGCDVVIDLRDYPESESRAVVCPSCATRMCRLCRQMYHGESGECEDSDGLAEWQRGMLGLEVANCPRCHAFIEKNGGCPEMKCTVCKTQFCWTCGQEFNHWLHRMQAPFQDNISQPPMFCTMGNILSSGLFLKGHHVLVRYLAITAITLFLPIGCLLAACIALQFGIPATYTIQYINKNGVSTSSKIVATVIYIMLLPFAFVAVAIFFPVGALLVALYYPFMLIYALFILTRRCFTRKGVNQLTQE